MKKYLVSFAVTGLSLLLITGMALAKGDFVTENEELFVIKDGAKTLVADTNVYENELNGDRKIYVAYIDSQNNEAHEGLDNGIYFFSQEGKLVSSLAVENADGYSVTFNSDGSRFLLENGEGEYPRYYTFYEFAGLKPGAKCVAWGAGEWVDNNYFIFTVADETQMRAENLSVGYQHGRLSVAVYDAAKNEVKILKEATATEDYAFSQINEETGQIDMHKFWVANANDWGNEDKENSDTASMPVLFNK